MILPQNQEADNPGSIPVKKAGLSPFFLDIIPYPAGKNKAPAQLFPAFSGWCGKYTKIFVMFFWNINKFRNIHRNMVDFVVQSCYNFNQSRSIRIFASKNRLALGKTVKKGAAAGGGPISHLMQIEEGSGGVRKQ